MGRPRKYIVQDGCWNCKSVFIKIDYDEETGYFCTFGAGPRPPCCSSSMKESPTTSVDLTTDLEDIEAVISNPAARLRIYESISDRVHDQYRKNWDKWSKNREVWQCGKCPRWEKRHGIRQ